MTKHDTWCAGDCVRVMSGDHDAYEELAILLEPPGDNPRREVPILVRDPLKMCGYSMKRCFASGLSFVAPGPRRRRDSVI